MYLSTYTHMRLSLYRRKDTKINSKQWLYLGNGMAGEEERRDFYLLHSVLLSSLNFFLTLLSFLAIFKNKFKLLK